MGGDVAEHDWSSGSSGFDSGKPEAPRPRRRYERHRPRVEARERLVGDEAGQQYAVAKPELGDLPPNRAGRRQEGLVLECAGDREARRRLAQHRVAGEQRLQALVRADPSGVHEKPLAAEAQRCRSSRSISSADRGPNTGSGASGTTASDASGMPRSAARSIREVLDTVKILAACLTASQRLSRQRARAPRVGSVSSGVLLGDDVVDADDGWSSAHGKPRVDGGEEKHVETLAEADATRARSRSERGESTPGGRPSATARTIALGSSSSRAVRSSVKSTYSSSPRPEPTTFRAKRP